MRPVWSSHRRACAYFLWNNITAHNTRNDLATDNHESSLPNSMSVAVPRLNCERRHGATGHLDCNEKQRKIIVEEEIKEARLTTSLSDSHIEVVNFCPPPFWLCLLQLFVTPLVNTTNFCSICVRHTSASISELLNLLSLHFTFQPVARQNLSLTFHGGICHRNNLTGLTFANVGPYRFPNRSERKSFGIILWAGGDQPFLETESYFNLTLIGGGEEMLTFVQIFSTYALCIYVAAASTTFIFVLFMRNDQDIFLSYLCESEHLWVL